jgi:sortase A
MPTRRTLGIAALLFLFAGGGLLGRRGYLEAKGLLARALIERAFAAHLRDGAPHRPWAWADTYPIAVLEVDRLHVRCPVLAGASGTSLAFGAGHIDGTAPPNAPGHSVLAGHRDREFRFLRDLAPGDVLRLRTAGAEREYIVDGASVVRGDDSTALQPTTRDRLTLVTCYPFGGLWRSPLRYVVTAAPRADRMPCPITNLSSPPAESIGHQY